MTDKVYSSGWCPRGTVFDEAFEMLYDIETAYFHALLARPLTIRRGGIYWTVDGNSDD